MLLALDTASRMMSLALHDGQRLHYEATWHTANNHTVELSPAIRDALARTQITPADFTAVAVSQGPGSFTGLRIGLSVAKGLAMAQHIPLVAIPTLDIVAAAIPAFNGPLIAVLQAGRGRICAQGYEWHDPGAWIPAGPAAITAWDQLVRTITTETLVAGEIDAPSYDYLKTAGHPVRIVPAAVALRRAGFLAEIAWTRIRTRQTDDPASVTPIYLHQPGVPHP